MTTSFLGDCEYKLILEWSYGLAIDSLWLSVCKIYSDASYDECKGIFLQVLYRVLLERKARLACGDFLKGTVLEQVESFKFAWPAKNDIDEALFWVTNEGVSWVPGGLVWLYEDGTEIWT